MPGKTPSSTGSVSVNKSADGLHIIIPSPLADQFDPAALQNCLSTFATCAATSDCIGMLTKTLGGFCGQGAGTAGASACESASAQLLSTLCGYKAK